MKNSFLRTLARHYAIPVAQRLMMPQLAKVPGTTARLLGLEPLPPRSVCRDLQEWASGGAGRNILPIAPAEKMNYPLPRSIEGEPDWHFRVAAETINPPTFVVTVPKGHVVGASGAVITAEGCLLAQLSPDWFFKPEQHPLFWRLRLPAIKTLKGRYASVASLSGFTYPHWVLDVLPRFSVLERAGIAWRELDGIIVNGPSSGWKQEMLDLLQIPQSKRIYVGGKDHYQCDELIVPSYAYIPNGFTSQIVDWMQHAFGGFRSPQKPGCRLYVARGKATYRKVTNEEEVASLLDRYGYQTVFCEDLSFRQKIELFSSAESVVAAHGAGMAHLLFCQPGTRMLEIFAPEYINCAFWAISNATRLRYHYIVGNGKYAEQGADPHAAEEDVDVDLRQLEKALKQFGFA